MEVLGIEDTVYISISGWMSEERSIEIQILDEKTTRSLNFSFEADLALHRVMADQFVILSTSLCPEIVYLNHDEERSPIEAVKRSANEFFKQLPLSSFIAEGPSSSKVVSLSSGVLPSSFHFFKSLLPAEPSRRKKVDLDSSAPVVELQLLQDCSVDDAGATGISIRYDAIRPSEPSLDDSTHEHFEKNAKVFHAFYPRLSVITYVKKRDKEEDSMELAMKRHLKSIRRQVEAHIKRYQNMKQKRQLPHLEPFHFRLGSDAQSEIVTLLYEVPLASIDWRADYAWCLNETPSSLGVECAITLSPPSLEATKPSSSRSSSRSSILDSVDSSTATEPRLHDVHLSVPSPGSSYEVHLVKGSYEYYHYCQDGYDDKGWGCAYRSMQTIVSWILKQHLSIKAVPSHVEIQRILVDMLDKPPSFINSKQWIGAVEISMCLSQHWDVVSKILHAQDGTKVSSYINDFIKHFDTLGSPIMAGGSVLAYTVLGVAVNVSKPLLPNGQPDIKYLILDPHYTGSESISTIISDQWCAWKPPTIWKKDAFYNFCLPQTPKWDDLV